MHGLNEELGRYREREDGMFFGWGWIWECESVLCECLHVVVYTRASFMKKVQELLEDNNEDFESLNNIALMC